VGPVVGGTLKSKRMKLFVAYILKQGKRLLAGLIGGYDADDARRLFAVERRLKPEAVEVIWTGSSKVTFKEYLRADDKQAEFLVR